MAALKLRDELSASPQFTSFMIDSLAIHQKQEEASKTGS